MRLLLQNQIIISCLLATTTAQLPTSSPAPTGFFGPPTIIATLPAATTSTTANIATLPAIPNVRLNIVDVNIIHDLIYCAHMLCVDE